MSKPILCLDFDGVIHSYQSGWQGAGVAADPPVPGAMNFIDRATDYFDVQIHSSRSHQPLGIECMQAYVFKGLVAHYLEREIADDEREAKHRAHLVMSRIQFPAHKPPAMVSIDDRALTFTGTWPAVDELLAFKPWNKR